jgi:hypothetical protein
MTPFEQHMRKYHPNSTVARLSLEVESLRAALNPEPSLPWEPMTPSGQIIMSTSLDVLNDLMREEDDDDE